MSTPLAELSPTAHACALDDHPLFDRHQDPISQAVCYTLRERLGEVHKGLYFVRPSVCGPGQWLWFSVCNPPSPQPRLACVSLDPSRPELRLFPGSMLNGNPLVEPGGDSAVVPVGSGLYRFRVDGSWELLWRMPDEVLKGRHLFKLCTEVTQSCDGRLILLDSEIGNVFYIATLELATADYRPLRHFARRHYHTAFSLHDPTLFMVNLGQNIDPITGIRTDMDVRTWVMDTTLTRYEPMDPSLWFKHTSMGCHEWWTPSGKINWCDYNEGIWEIELPSRAKRLVWSRPLIHGQVDPAERWYVGDANCYNWNDRKPCSVWLFDRLRQAEVPIVSRMPPQPLPWPDFRAYHIDPHPCFSDDGHWISFTSTLDGSVNVSLCPMGQFKA